MGLLPQTAADIALADAQSPQPITMRFTKEELMARAKEYMVRFYGKPGQGCDADKWMERFGLLCGFIDEQFTPEPMYQ